MVFHKYEILAPKSLIVIGKLYNMTLSTYYTTLISELGQLSNIVTEL